MGDDADSDMIVISLVRQHHRWLCHDSDGAVATVRTEAA